ncbi:hypothetical protein Tco_0022166 [Tanacetum coccineum]
MISLRLNRFPDTPEHPDDVEKDDDDEGEDDEDGWEVNEEWLMAPVTPPQMSVVPAPSAFEVGRLSTAAPGPPFPVGRPFPEVVSSVAVHHEEIGGLSVRIKNLEHAHGVLARKMGNMSDAQLNDGIAIGEIQPRVTTLEGQVEVLASQQEQAMTKVGEVEDQLEMQDKVNNYPCGQVDGLREDVDELLGLKDQVQTLEYTVHELRKENQKLKGLLSAKDSDYSMLASYVLGLGERLAATELQLSGPPQGPQ